MRDVLGFGFWILDHVVAILYTGGPRGVWILDFGQSWNLDFGFWILDFLKNFCTNRPRPADFKSDQVARTRHAHAHTILFPGSSTCRLLGWCKLEMGVDRDKLYSPLVQSCMKSAAGLS